MAVDNNDERFDPARRKFATDLWVRELKSDLHWWRTCDKPGATGTTKPLELPAKDIPDAVEAAMWRDNPPAPDSPKDGWWSGAHAWENYYLVCVQPGDRDEFRRLLCAHTPGDNPFDLPGADRHPNPLSERPTTVPNLSPLDDTKELFSNMKGWLAKLLLAYRMRNVLVECGLIEENEMSDRWVNLEPGQQRMWSWRVRGGLKDILDKSGKRISRYVVYDILEPLPDRVESLQAKKERGKLDPPKLPSVRSLLVLEEIFGYPLILPMAIDMNTITRTYRFQ